MPYLLTTQFNGVVLQTIFSYVVFGGHLRVFFRGMTLCERIYCTGVEADVSYVHTNVLVVF